MPGPSSPIPFDPDLDDWGASAPLPESRAIESYQRLIVNPCLTLLGWLIALAVASPFSRLMRRLEQTPRLLTALVAVTILVVTVIPMRLVQYHCLDCGATGWLSRRRRHTCPSVIQRARGRAPARPFLGLGVKHQLIGWFYVVLVALLVLGIVFHAAG